MEKQLEERRKIAKQISELTQRLYEHRRRALLVKTRDITELDRTTHMQADTAELEAELIYLQKLDDILKDEFIWLASRDK